MVSIGLVRAISAGDIGLGYQTWNAFWIQIEASVSVIAVCPAASRSLFLLNNAASNHPDGGIRHPGQRSVVERLWRKTRPSLQSIRIPVTITGMRTMTSRTRKTQPELQDDDRYALSSVVAQNPHSSLSFEEQKQGVGPTHQSV